MSNLERVSAAHTIHRGRISFLLPGIIFGRLFLQQTLKKSINNTASDTLVADTEFIILENIYDSSRQPLRQRELAQIAGASLGMTNSILKRMAQKGWITVKKLNSRNIQYAVTLEGINEIIHRSYRYFKRTIRNVVFFKDILEDAINRARNNKMKSVILVGTSDLDFIIEHICRHWGMRFSKFSENETVLNELASQSLIIYAESITDSINPHSFAADGTVKGADTNCFYLSRLIIKQAARARWGDN